MTLDGFRTNFRKELEEVGLLGLDPPLTFHGLRKNATVALIEAGCTEAEAKSITGHKITQMITKYSIGVPPEAYGGTRKEHLGQVKVVKVTTQVTTNLYRFQKNHLTP